MVTDNGWFTSCGSDLRITEDRRQALFFAWYDLADQAQIARHRGDIRRARALAETARRLVHNFGRRTFGAGPIVGHA